jgi:hypothetical protein
VNHQCSVHSDCVLMVRGCCGSCLPPKSADEVRALPRANLSSMPPSQCSGVNCGECYVTDPNPLDPIETAGCVEHACQLVDVRADDILACRADSDCEAVNRGCCPASSGEPSEYVGVQRDADQSLLACWPLPPCMPPSPHAEPIAFCAADHHCAVRRRETRDGQVSSACFSPTQNVDHTREPAAVGCDCAPGSLPVCVADAAGRSVSMTCDDQYWRAADISSSCG